MLKVQDSLYFLNKLHVECYVCRHLFILSIYIVILLSHYPATEIKIDKELRIHRKILFIFFQHSSIPCV